LISRRPRRQNPISSRRQKPPAPIDFHTDNARTKLGAATRTAAAIKAATGRLIEPEWLSFLFESHAGTSSFSSMQLERAISHRDALFAVKYGNLREDGQLLRVYNRNLSSVLCDFSSHFSSPDQIGFS
jgi:hypothetical protein